MVEGHVVLLWFNFLAGVFWLLVNNLSFTLNNKRAKIRKENLSWQNQMNRHVETDGTGFYTPTLKAS